MDDGFGELVRKINLRYVRCDVAHPGRTAERLDENEIELTARLERTALGITHGRNAKRIGRHGETRPAELIGSDNAKFPLHGGKVPVVFGKAVKDRRIVECAATLRLGRLVGFKVVDGAIMAENPERTVANFSFRHGFLLSPSPLHHHPSPLHCR